MTSPLRRVLVPLDGSPLAEQALPVADVLARAAGAALHLATVTPPVSAVPGSPAGTTAEHALHEGMRAYLEEQAASLGAPGPPATCAVLDGPAARSLAAYARAHEVDLVVMTTHGWGGPKRLWLGSVADELLRRVRSPVLLLRPDRTRQAVGYHRVLVALDGSPGCEAVLESAMAVATLFPVGHYTLAQVIEPPPPAMLRMVGAPTDATQAWVEHHRAEVVDRLERLGRGLRGHGFATDVRALVGPGTAEQLLDLARDGGSDLLVIGTRAPHEVERLVLGSVADKIVRGAAQPVLVVPLEPATSAATRPAPTAAALSQSGPTP